MATDYSEEVIYIHSRELNKDDIRYILQAIRDAETRHFPDKAIRVFISVPDFSTQDCMDILASITPPFPTGPFVLDRKGQVPIYDESGFSSGAGVTEAP